ncbi:serine hydrolase domain-containing protein [Nonomuraea ceibae]|uniref:serine hydrolase domain-containing protein n=1 Tax=Nonomuraea ceibae TaxID=1935170 RepID=UPI001C60333E|nr:serine hydrolase domain-containing protein [Nonomuraea ceibae]
MAGIRGICHPRFSSVRDRFADNFAEGRELGASLCVYQHGEPVVDLWGGLAAEDRPWRQDTLALLASTTKGMAVAALLLLVDRGILDLDTPVADYWPEFAAEGKGRMPLRWILGHRSGVVVIDPPLTLDDIERGSPVADALACARPAWRPGSAHGYHCLTLGWLVSEVVRRVTGLTVGRLFAREIAAPLGLDLHIGIPAHQEGRLASVVAPTAGEVRNGRADPELHELNRAICSPASLLHRATYGSVVLTPELLGGSRLYRAEVPSACGVGTAAGLARLYAALIGEVDGIRLLRPETVARARAVEARGRDLVLRLETAYSAGFMLPGGPMWPPFGAPNAFGYAGATGAFAFADPDTGLAFAYVPNRMSELIEGSDGRVWPLMRESHRCARGG